jgi:uncharacterized protein (TIGR03435 family)
MIAKLIASVLLSTFAAHSQPAYEVASIKPSPPDQPGTHMSNDASRLMLHNATLKYCIQTAYRLQDFQLSGGPKWLDSDHYDIEGKASAAASHTALLGMLQTLLADRFQLQFHRETRLAPGYALLPAKSGTRLPKPKFEGRTPGNSWGGSMVRGTNQTMAGLTEALSHALERPVVDETGYKEPFDYHLTWAPNRAPTAPGDGGSSDAGPSIFAVIQEQLGLKLEARRVPVEVVIIDRAEKPAAN